MEKAVGVKEDITPTTRMGRRKKRKDDITSTTRIGLKRLRKEKVYRESWYKIFVLSYFILMLGFLALRLILPTPTMSLAENRELKKMPQISLQNIFFGKFTTEFEDYFADTFPLRDPLMNVGEYVSYLYKIPVRGVDSIVVADNNIVQDESPEGWEESESAQEPAADSTAAETEPNPLTGETPAPAPKPQEALKEQKGTYLLTDTAIFKEVVLDPELYGSWADGINRLAAALPGKRIMAMTPPNSFPFYADAKYFKPENDERAGIADMYGQLDEGIIAIDPTLQLESRKSEYIYFRTDLHWTARGAYCGYLSFCGKAGITPLTLDEFRPEAIYPDFLGGYYQQVKKYAKAKIIKESPDYIEYFVPPAECAVMIYNDASLKNGREGPMFDTCVEGKATYYYLFLGEDYPCMKITTDTNNGRTLMMLKDSYADALTPYMVAHYQTIYIIDFRDYNTKGKPKFKAAEFAEKNDVDDVLCMINFDFVNNPKYVNWYLKALP